MLSIVFTAISILMLGAGLCGWLKTKYTIALAPLLGCAGFCWLSFALASLIGFGAAEILFAAGLCLAAGAVLLLKYKTKIELQKDFALAAVITACMAVFLGYSLLQLGPDGQLHGFTTDFNFHASFVSSIASFNFPPQYPFFLKGVPLSYYYFPQFLAANFIKLGATLQTAFLVFPLSIAISVLLLYAVSKQLTRSRKAAVLSVFAFLFFSSISIVPYLQQNLSGRQDVISLLGRPQASAASSIYSQNLPIESVLSSLLLPQRSLPFGLALGLACLLILLEGAFSRKSLLAGGVLMAASVPFHALVALAFFALLSVFLLLHKFKESWLFVLPSLAGFALSIPLFFSDKLHSAASTVSLAIGWMAADKSPLGIAVFWAFNLVFFAVPAAIGYKSLPRELKLLLASSLPVFFAINLFSVTPNLWDSVKFLLPMLAILAIASSHALLNAAIFKRFRLLAAAFVLAGSLYGLLLLQTTLQHSSDVIFTSGELSACSFISQHTPPDAFFATSHQTTCVVALAGRRVVVGELYQLKENAIDPAPAEELNAALLAGNCTLARQWGVGYFYDGGSGQLPGSANYTFFDAQGKKIWTDGVNSVYKLSC